MGLALAVGIAGYVLTSLNYTGEIPANLLTQVGVLVAIAIIAEVGVHFLAPYADPVILPVAVALTGLGLAMIYRLDLARRPSVRASGSTWVPSPSSPVSS